ncbi:uncharacterized protein [Heptranchias perlo]|uniref:uncharacterized protein n=1 Tax=Heptranchias perlo TaxID=212740 RepID=UPI0035597AD9
MEGTSAQHVGDGMIDVGGEEYPEVHTSFQLDTRDHGVAACWDHPGSARRDRTVVQQSSSVNQHRGFPRPAKALALSEKRLSSVQDKTVGTKDNHPKRKWEVLERSAKQLGDVVTPKQPAVDSVSTDHQGRGNEGVDSAKSGPRLQICDLFTLDTEQRSTVLEEVAHASAIILTMVYQDGSSQLTAVKPAIEWNPTALSMWLRLSIEKLTYCEALRNKPYAFVCRPLSDPGDVTGGTLERFEGKEVEGSGDFNSVG